MGDVSLLDSPSGFSHYKDKLAQASAAAWQEGEVDYSSEDHTVSPSPPPSSGKSVAPPGGRRQESLSSQDSKSDGSSLSQTHLNGFHRNVPNEAVAPAAAAELELAVDEVPPALPPKTRKAKSPEAPKEPELSDRGDSDMDEETYSSSHEKQKPKKVPAEGRGHFN